MTIYKRVMEIRNALHMSQEAFGEGIELSKSGISNIENEVRGVTDRHIKLICLVYNVNEEWLRNGTGEMFIENEWDAYGILHNMSGLERKALKAYMSIDRNIRQIALEQFMAFFAEQEQTATAEEEIQTKVKQYEQELIEEHRKKTLLASTVSNEVG
ncbi:MAG: helix-turn-helix transcriptional regulator [Paenibacillaceae bacterium]